MRKLFELHRLHFDVKLRQRQIVRSSNLGQSTEAYLARFGGSGVTLPLPAGLSEAELQSA